MKVGFEASVTINGNAIKTVGDITAEVSNTEIEVKNRASRKVRYLSGMEVFSFEIDVMQGTDPDDPGGVDGCSVCQALFDSDPKETAVIVYKSADGSTRTENCICTKASPTDPVDGLAVKKFTFKPSAEESSGGGSGS